MTIAKMLCGVWLIDFSGSIPSRNILLSPLLRTASNIPFCGRRRGRTEASSGMNMAETSRKKEDTRPSMPNKPPTADETKEPSETQRPNLTSRDPAKPKSLYPSTITTFAMVARGEIDFLISALAQSNGIFDPSSSLAETKQDIFLVVTWAFVICTIVGLLCVGLLVNLVKRLEKRRQSDENGSTN